MTKLLQIAIIILTTITSAVYTYHGVIIIIGLINKRRNNKSINNSIVSNCYNRICVLVCARNEEAVIGRLIESLKKQDYPKECYRICVVADNCTDNTAQISRNLGATVYERFNDKKQSKGYALNYFFNTNTEHFDAYCIFDADNIVSTSYLTSINKHLNNGETLIQGYRIASNPTESAIASCYALYFSFVMNLYMKSRQKLGLSCIVGGTGFAFSSELVSNGWNTQSITEDAEFSIQNILNGKKVTLAEDAQFYDEQPTSFSASITQRHRWTVGTIQLLKNYAAKLTHSCGSKAHQLICFDIIMFLIAAPISALPIITSVLFPFVFLLSGIGIWGFVLACVQSIIVSYLYNLLLAAITTVLAGEKIKQLWRGILVYPFFFLSWSIIALKCCISDRCVWKPIIHKSSKISAEA